MHHHYEDIYAVAERAGAAVAWWDEHAVPRFCEFSPREIASVYADECALVLISCQSCNTSFRVAFSTDKSHRMLRAAMGKQDVEAARLRSLAASIRDGSIHYGDPPNAGCCPAGPTMNCNDLRVLEYWRRESFDWCRDASLEIDLVAGPPETSEGPDNG